MRLTYPTSALADAEYPEILAGLYTPEENFHVGTAEVVDDAPASDLNERFAAKPAGEDKAVDAEFEEAGGDDGPEGDDTDQVEIEV